MANILCWLFPRRLRDWADGRGLWRRSWCQRFVSRCAFAVADHYDRDPSRCWAHLAMWAMGFDGYTLQDKTDPGCDWCGKCKTHKAMSPGRKGGR